MTRSAAIPYGRALPAELAALDTVPQPLTDDARQWLLAQAHGSTERLRMLVATAVFLAETEDAPRIDVELARRAGALQPASVGQRLPIAVGRRHRDTIWSTAGWMLAIVVWTMASMLAGMVLTTTLWSNASAPARHAAPVPAPSPQATASQAAPVMQTPVMRAPVMQGRGPQASAPQASAPAAHAQPAPVAAAPPAPSAGQANPAPAAAPVQPSQAAAMPPPVPVVQLHFFLSSPQSAPRARFVEQRLESAGFVVRTVPELRSRRPRAPAVIYFNPDDAGSARRVDEVSLLVNRKPILARWHGRRSPPPGTIELLLP